MDFIEQLASHHNIHLNPQQRQAVLTTEGPVLLLAVPGSGKTTVLAARTAFLVMERAVPPEQILTLTFNRSARLDMEARFRSLFQGRGAEAVRFATIHSFCNSVLRQYGSAVGRQVPRLMEDGKARLLRQIHSEINGGEFLPDDRLEELTNAIGLAKNRMMTDEQIEAGEWATRNFPAIFAAYESYKNQNGCMDFDDMLDKALAAFRVMPRLLERCRDQYRYVSVDEAQDVSLLQHEIIRLLAAPRNNLFMVGDEDQSIYGFRAASPDRLLRFEQDYPGAKVLLMERNYRSAEPIIAAANRLIRRNRARRAKAMAGRGAAGPAIAQTTLPESAGLPGHVLAWLKQDLSGSRAVLLRENGSALALMDALDRAAVPFTMREHKADFFTGRVVRDLLAFLALAHDPLDAAALRQIYWKLGAAVSRDQMDAAAQLLARGQAPSALEALLALPGLRETTTKRLSEVRAGMAELAQAPLRDAIALVLDRLNYRDHLKKTFGAGPAMLSALHTLDILSSIIAGVGDTPALLARIDELSALAQRGGSGGPGALTISTAHSAKGLEFDHVLVADLIDGRFPTGNAIAALAERNAAPMEEERRLFYVALTRARQTAELVTCQKVLGHKAEPSRFIAEALPGVALKRALASHATKRPAAKAAEMPSGMPEGLEPGVEVMHRQFGRGEVLEVDGESGIVTVRFAKVGVKVISAAYCRVAGDARREGSGDD